LESELTKLDRRVLDIVGGHPLVSRIELIGSRARGDATPFSDWDFGVDTQDFAFLSDAMPMLVEPLHPVARQWDRLSERRTYMLVLEGPRKVDFVFGVPNHKEPPWQVRAETLAPIDDHFWDWILWLASKDARGANELVHDELEKLFEHILGPMGVAHPPTDIATAVAGYAEARSRAERKHGVVVSPNLEREVRKVLEERG
jgi:predicted nucleotidyltransferase